MQETAEQNGIRRLRLEELRRDIQKGMHSSERGDVLTFSSSEELADPIEAQGRKILADRKARKQTAE